MIKLAYEELDRGRNMLTFGIIGLPLVGKTTIFNLVTGKGAQTSQYITDKTTINVGRLWFLTARVDFLGKVYQPKRLTYAQIQCQDVPGLKYGSGEEKGQEKPVFRRYSFGGCAGSRLTGL